jgi:single-stranded DNA-binding protein
MSTIRIDIEGNITTTPELRLTPAGKSVCKFRLLSTARIQDDGGGWRDGTTAFGVTLWGKPAENAATRLRKGTSSRSPPPASRRNRGPTTTTRCAPL